MLSPKPSLSTVMATDDPGADQVLMLLPQDGPNLDKPPCQCPSPGLSTTLLKRAWVGLRDSVGQLCSVSRSFMDRRLASVPWKCCPAAPAGPRALSTSATVQQGRGCQAVMATLCQCPGATPPPPGPVAPRELESRPGVCKQSGWRLRGSKQWPQEGGPSGNEYFGLVIHCQEHTWPALSL